MQRLNEIRAAELEANTGAAGQEFGHAAMKAGSQTKTNLDDELDDELRAINRTDNASPPRCRGRRGMARR